MVLQEHLYLLLRLLLAGLIVQSKKTLVVFEILHTPSMTHERFSTCNGEERLKFRALDLGRHLPGHPSQTEIK